MSSHHRELPLTGIRIIDLSHDWAGPHAGRLLGDLGAEVVKVEYSRRLDGMRGGEKRNRAYDQHPRWLQVNRNKLSVTLDLKDAHEAATFRELVRVTDILIENSRAGVMERLGFNYASLRNLREDLIFVSMTAFGQSGPEATYAGYGGTIEALSGIQALTAYTRSERAMRIKEMDVTNGILGACAIMTALAWRQKTGRGQWIDLSELEAATTGLIGEHLLEYVMNHAQTLPLGNRHAYHAPQGCYRSSGDDKWIAVTIRSDEEWQSLCEVMGHPDLARDPRFETRVGRSQAHDELDRVIEAWTQTHTNSEAMHMLQRAGIAAGAVLSVEDLVNDPHLRARSFFQTAKDGSGVYPGTPFGALGDVRRRGPHLGEHNEYVVADLLQRPEDQITPLTEDQIGTAYEIE